MKNDELKEVYYKLYHQLFLYALSLTKNKADAEDLVSNAFVKAILSFDQGDIKPWLYKVLKNEFYNYRKRKKRIIEDYEFERVSDNKDLSKDIIKDERRQWLYAEIYALKEPEREVMLLSLQGDLSDESIAEIIGISVQNVRVIRFRVKNKLKEKYEEEAV